MDTQHEPILTHMRKENTHGGLATSDTELHLCNCWTEHTGDNWAMVVEKRIKDRHYRN